MFSSALPKSLLPLPGLIVEIFFGTRSEGIPGESEAVKVVKSEPERLSAGICFRSHDVSAEARDHADQLVQGRWLGGNVAS